MGEGHYWPLWLPPHLCLARPRTPLVTAGAPFLGCPLGPTGSGGPWGLGRVRDAGARSTGRVSHGGAGAL